MVTDMTTEKIPRDQPHHYRYYTTYCPVCSRGGTFKERHPGLRIVTGDPITDYWAYHEETEHYDYCLG